MDVSARRSAVVAALLVALSACTDEDEESLLPSPENSLGDESSSGSSDTLADLDRLIAEADAYRFVAALSREDNALSFGTEDEFDLTGTDLYGGFERVTDGNMANYLGEVREDLVEQTTKGCLIGGSYDGVEFDDFEQDDEGDSEFSEYVSAGTELLVSSESQALGTLRPYIDAEDGQPFYEWDRPEEIDDITMSALTVDVPGDIFPGVGTVTLPATSLDGVAFGAPLTLEFMLRWQSENSTRFLVALQVRGEGGAVDIECVTDDDGTFRLPDATLTRLPEGLQEVVYYDVERLRADIVPMGETIFITYRFMSQTLFEAE